MEKEKRKSTEKKQNVLVQWLGTVGIISFF
jgi:hypothetical protein